MTADTIALGALIVALLAFAATAWQGFSARGQLQGLRTQVSDLLEARRGKIYKLRRAVNNLHDELQNVPADGDATIIDLNRVNISRLSAIEASSDTFFFGELAAIPELTKLLGDLDQATQDAQSDLQRLRSAAPDTITPTDVISAAAQITTVYSIAGKCLDLLNSIELG